jgi:hypothetical protein
MDRFLAGGFVCVRTHYWHLRLVVELDLNSNAVLSEKKTVERVKIIHPSADYQT